MSFDSTGFGPSKLEHATSLFSAAAQAAHSRPGSRGGAAASPALSPPASAFVFSVDGSGLLKRRTASSSSSAGGSRGGVQPSPYARNGMTSSVKGAPPARGQSAKIPSNDYDGGGMGGGVGGCPTTASSSSSSPSPLMSRRAAANTSTGLLPSAASLSSFPSQTISLNARKSNLRPASAGPASVGPNTQSSASSRPAPSSAAHAEPQFNNYVMGQSAATATLRHASSAKARPSRRPPRTPSTQLLPRASSCGLRPSPHTTSTANESLHDEAVGGAAEEEDTRSRTNTPARTSTLYAPAPTRPLLRHLSIRRSRDGPVKADGVGYRRQPSAAHNTTRSSVHNSNTSSSSSYSREGHHIGTQSTTNAAAAATGPSAVRHPHVPVIQMTRSFALLRPVLLTKDSSAAATSVSESATSHSRSTPRSTPRKTPSPSSPPAIDPTEVSCEPAATFSHAASSRAHAFSPAPPPPRVSSAQSHRMRKGSLLSTASNSSAAFLRPQRENPRSQEDEEAAAVRLFFQAMPAFEETRKASDDTEGAENGVSGEVVSAAEVASSPTVASAKAQPQPTRFQPERKTELQDSIHEGAPLRSERPGSAAVRGSISITQILQRSNSGRSQQLQQQSSQRPSSSSSFSLAANVNVNGSLCGSPHAGAHHVVERLRERGNQYMMHEEFAQAIATYSEAIRLAPYNDVLWSNRASAFLLTFRYLPAVADCLYVLYLRPGTTKAYWRAAKAYAAAYKFLEAKKYYLLAEQACLKEVARAGSASLPDSPTHKLDGSSSSGGGNGVSDEERRQRRAGSSKAAKDRDAIVAEERAMAMVEQYWQHMRCEQWPEAVAVMDAALALGNYRGPTAVSWQALRFEALLPSDPKAVLTQVEALHKRYPDALELYYVLAKALFYTVHDAASTTRCLEVLDEAAERRSAQNTLLNVHVRYAAMQLREHNRLDSGDTAAVQLEAWARRSQLREDSRVAELRHSIDKFARHRDAGNRAYEKGNWDAAAAAYTQCLQTDRHNHALLAAVYCNRTAAYMQAGRWREALGDADAALRLSPQLATAYGRRGRIQLYLLSQEYEAQRAILARHFTTQWSAAVKTQLMQYADAAVADLTRAVELMPTAEHKSQLQHMLAQRQIIKTALNTAAAPQQGAQRGTSASSRPFSRTGSGASYPRAYAGSRPASSSSIPAFPATPRSVVQEHLQLLGLHITATAAAAGALPDLKVVAKAYRESALRWHPDKWVTATPQEQQEAERQFKLISVAYNSLREQYGNSAATT